MKKLRVSLLLAAMAAMVFVGCGKKEDPVTETVAEEPVAEEPPAEEPEAEPVAEEPEEEVIPEGKVKDQTTNEWIDEALENQRPIAVMFNNIIDAVPQTSISKAGVVYEAPVEGNLTRLMGIIKDYEGLEKIGSIRSCRAYYVYWALEWNSIYCHFGGPELYVKDVLARKDVHNLNGLQLDGSTYYRSKDRKAPHNAYTSGDRIVSALGQFKYEREYNDSYTGAHYLFADKSDPVTLENGIDATYVAPGYPINKPWFEYNEEDGLYYRFQYGKEHIDDLDGNQLAYKNIIIQNTTHEKLDAKDYLAFHFNDSGKTGYYITNGKAIEITWEKTNDLEPTRYYDKNGGEIILNTGKTWVCIVKDSSKDDIVIK